MKIRRRDTLPQANKVFTDREEPIESFWRLFNKIKAGISEGEDIQVLTYYGIGGIGKTSLLHKLMAEMDSTLKRSLHAYIDLNIRRESGSVLNSLRNILSEKYSFNFPMFDLAFYVYAKKTGEKLQQDTAEGLIDKSPFLGTVAEVLGEIPIIGILKKLDKCAGYVKSLIDKRKRDLTAIDTEPLDVIYRRLPYYFSLDISDNLEKSDTPLVIFIDTYETLVNEMAGVGEPSNHDLWIRGDDGLVQNSQRVMWVIAGREKLRWADINSDWNDSIEQHMLGNLSYSDAKYFLNSAGIYDEALTEAIYDLTSGTPVFLDLCVDNYYSIIERGKTPAIGDFKGNTTVIIERFLRYMDDSRKDLTYLLSCLKVWDDDTFHKVAGEVMPGYSFTTYERIKGASFVIKGNDGNYTMHQTVQSVVYSACPEFIREKANDSLNRYYSEALCKYSVTSPEFSVILSRYVGLIVSRSYNEENFSRIYSGLEKHLNAAMDSFQFDLLLSCMEMMTDYAEKSMPNTAVTARLYNDYAKDLAASGRYNEAVIKARAAEEIYREIFGETDEKTLEAVDTVSRCLYLAGDYKGSHETAERVYDKAVAALGEDNPVVLMLLKELGTSCEFLGRYDEALMLKQKLLEKRRSLSGENHPYTLTAMLNLGNTFYSVGRYKEALELRQEVLSKRREILGENHPDTLAAMNNLANSYNSLGRYQEALELKQEVLAKRRELLGENHPDTISAMNNLAISYSSLGQYQEALNLKQEVLAKRREILGENHPYTASDMNNLADTYNKLHDYNSALPLARKALEMEEEIFGKGSIKTSSTLDTISEALSGLGQHSEAIKIQEEAVRIRVQVLGETHPRTIEHLENLAERFRAAGEQAKASEIEAKVKSLRKNSK